MDTIYILQVSKLTKHIYLIQMQRYLGRYDSLNIEDKQVLIDNLTQRHSAGLTFGMQCVYTCII